jgi:hypothetical protein
LNGQWAVSGALPALTLNGKSTGLQIGPFQPERLLRPFTLASGFISGVNTLDFVVTATGAAELNVATGLRVELRGVAGQLPPNTAPSFLEQPLSQTLIEGEGVILTAAARGSSPLSYQWRHDGVPIAGATAIPALAAVGRTRR